jgi:hypothetical protein
MARSWRFAGGALFGKGECATECAMASVTTWHGAALAGTVWHNRRRGSGAETCTNGAARAARSAPSERDLVRLDGGLCAAVWRIGG